MRPRATRAGGFAATYFAVCSAHRREAELAFEALERLANRVLLDVIPDMAVGDILRGQRPPDAAPGDSLDAVELELALEEELGERAQVQRAVRDALAARTLRMVLGSAFEKTTWTAETVWVRSVRGVINERVRYGGGCTCPEAPPNNELQRTRPAQAMEPRR
jgi:hypothetical protein